MAQLYQLEPDFADIIIVPSKLSGAARHLVPCATIVLHDESPTRAVTRYQRGEAWLHQHHIGVAPTQTNLQVWACSQLTFWNHHEVSIAALKPTSEPLSPPDTLIAYVGDAQSDAFVRRIKAVETWHTTKRLYLPMQSTDAHAAQFPLGQLSSLIRVERMLLARALFALKRQGMVIFDNANPNDMRQVAKLRLLAVAFGLEVKAQKDHIVVTRRERAAALDPLPIPRAISLTSKPAGVQPTTPTRS